MLFPFCRIVLLSVFFCTAAFCKGNLNGRYSKSLEYYTLAVPHKLTYHGNFHSFKLPYFYDYNSQKFRERREKRNLNDVDSVHYGIQLDNKVHHLELWPNTNYISPGLIFENMEPNMPLNRRRIRSLNEKQMCFFKGIVRGHPESAVVVSTCDGLVGSIKLGSDLYFIEPVDEHEANAEGHHLHVVYKRLNNHEGGSCGITDTWENSMKQRFMEKMDEGEDVKLFKRSLSSVERFLEILIVCDRKFVEYYKDVGLDTYVLTVMSMANELYHDASSGNLMDLSLVRIIYLEKEEDEIDLEITLEAMKTLTNFCKYTNALNPPVDSPMHHDMAVLLTRMDLCQKEGKECGMTGQAFMSGACTKDKNCAIVEDQGPLVGITIAHEIGHLIGCFHDSPKHGCEGIDKSDKTSFVMNPSIGFNTLRWSSCSRVAMNVFFEAGLGECLNDIPESSQYPIPTTLPGVVYGKGQQCKFFFGKTSVFCDKNFHKLCHNLSCKKSINEKKCYINPDPALDGTKCGENKWCFRGNCTEMGYRGPEAVHGGWSDWGTWSKCSRTCGGGVSFQSRECDNPKPANRGRYCVGERKRYRICNKQDCPEGSLNFRDFLCQSIKEPLNGVKYNWTGFKNTQNPCSFDCIDLATKKLHTFGKYIQDGARCKLGTKNTCINGVCRKVGCDFELDSNAVNDICGICNGDGTKCKIEKKVWTQKAKQGLNPLTNIPKGSVNLKIEALEPTKCLPVISSSERENRQYFLNDPSKGRIYENAEYDFGGVRGIYRQIESDKRQVFIHKAMPIELAISINCIKKPETDQTLSFAYSYSTLTNQSTYVPQYLWELAEYQECNVRCGGGIRQAIFDCIESKAGKVSESFCAGIDKPQVETTECNKQACPIRWKTSEWGSCKACKKLSGMRFRSVVCVKMNPIPGADDIVEDESKCSGPKPGSKELCQSSKKCKRNLEDEDLPLSERFLKDIWQQINRQTLNPYLEEYESKTCAAEEEGARIIKKSIDISDMCTVPEMKPLSVKVCDDVVSTTTETTCKPRKPILLYSRTTKKIAQRTSKYAKRTTTLLVRKISTKEHRKNQNLEPNHHDMKKPDTDVIEEILGDKNIKDISVKDMKELVGSIVLDENPEKHETVVGDNIESPNLKNISDEAQEDMIDDQEENMNESFTPTEKVEEISMQTEKMEEKISN